MFSHRSTAPASVLVAILAAACSDTPAFGPDAPVPNFVNQNRPNYGPPLLVTFRDDGTDNIRSDGRGSYEDRQCGVSATFNLNDVRVKTDEYPISPKEATGCGGRDPRAIKIAFTQPAANSPPNSLDGTIVSGNFMNVNEVELVTEADGVLRSAAFTGGCGQVKFNPVSYPGSSFVRVTKNPDGTWTVATQPYPDDVGVCTDGTGVYHLPFQLTVQLK